MCRTGAQVVIHVLKVVTITTSYVNTKKMLDHRHGFIQEIFLGGGRRTCVQMMHVYVSAPARVL